MVLDIVLVVIFILMLLYGCKKGFIGIVAKLVSAILAFVLAYILANTVGQYVSSTDIGVKMQTNISNFVMQGLQSNEQASELQILQNNLNITNEQNISEKVGEYVFTGVGFVLVFIVARIVLWIGQKILESIFELPVLKTFNRLGGIIASGVLFILEVSIILSVIECLSTLAFMGKAVGLIESSVITRAIYEHNIFTTIILSKIF